MYLLRKKTTTLLYIASSNYVCLMPSLALLEQNHLFILVFLNELPTLYYQWTFWLAREPIHSRMSQTLPIQHSGTFVSTNRSTTLVHHTFRVEG